MSCAKDAVRSHPTFGRFVYFKLLTLLPVSTGLIGLVRYGTSYLWAVLYIALCLVHAAIMNAIKCPHCPYYTQGDQTFSCFVWWSTPKLYEDRPGPESRWVGIYAPIGMLVLAAYPAFWLWHQWELLFLYVLSLIVLVLSIAHNECARCINFDCGHNTVPERVRLEYMAGGH